MLISEEEKARYKAIMRGKNVDPFRREALFKRILVECKKRRTCDKCGAHNGVVKKLPKFPLKIVHDKFA